MTNNNALKNNRVAPGGFDEATWTVTAKDNGSEVKVIANVSMTIENSVQKEISKEHYDLLNASGLTDVIYTEDGKYYYAPVVFTIEKNGDATNAQKFNHFEAGHVLTTTTDDTFKISWKWAFTAQDLITDGSTLNEQVINLIDRLDTELGKENDENKKIQVIATASAVQDTLDRRQGTADLNKIVTTANTNDVADLENNWGYDSTKTAAVTFDGTTISGTINKNTNATLLSKFPVSDPQGYYYPISIEAEAGTTVKIGALNMKTLSVGADGSLTVLMALDSVNKTPIKVQIGNLPETTITYDGLTFAE